MRSKPCLNTQNFSFPSDVIWHLVLDACGLPTWGTGAGPAPSEEEAPSPCQAHVPGEAGPEPSTLRFSPSSLFSQPSNADAHRHRNSRNGVLCLGVCMPSCVHHPCLHQEQMQGRRMLDNSFLILYNMPDAAKSWVCNPCKTDLSGTPSSNASQKPERMSKMAGAALVWRQVTGSGMAVGPQTIQTPSPRCHRILSQAVQPDARTTKRKRASQALDVNTKNCRLVLGDEEKAGRKEIRRRDGGKKEKGWREERKKEKEALVILGGRTFIPMIVATKIPLYNLAGETASLHHLLSSVACDMQ